MARVAIGAERLANFLEPSFRKVRGTGPVQEVRLRFSPLAGRYVREKTWHATQRIDDQPDGGLVLTLRVNHLLEVKRWALSWGADCGVLRTGRVAGGDQSRAAGHDADHE
jgi:hypothetical protein